MKRSNFRPRFWAAIVVAVLQLGRVTYKPTHKTFMPGQE